MTQLETEMSGSFGDRAAATAPTTSLLAFGSEPQPNLTSADLASVVIAATKRAPSSHGGTQLTRAQLAAKRANHGHGGQRAMHEPTVDEQRSGARVPDADERDAAAPTESARTRPRHGPSLPPHTPIQRASTVPGGVFVGERFPHLTIATPRLHVRPHSPADADRVTEIFSDRLTKRWLPFSADYGPIDGRAWCGEMAAERRAMGQGDHYAIVRREDDELIGCLWTKRTDWPARSTEVSFALASEARGYGFAAEAVDGLVIELIMRHQFERVEMRVAPGNTGSRRVAEKAGFQYEGLLRNAGYVHSGRVDLEIWSLVTGDLR